MKYKVNYKNFDGFNCQWEGVAGSQEEALELAEEVSTGVMEVTSVEEVPCE